MYKNKELSADEQLSDHSRNVRSKANKRVIQDDNSPEKSKNSQMNEGVLQDSQQYDQYAQKTAENTH